MYKNEGHVFCSILGVSGVQRFICCTEMMCCTSLRPKVEKITVPTTTGLSVAPGEGAVLSTQCVVLLSTTASNERNNKCHSFLCFFLVFLICSFTCI